MLSIYKWSLNGKGLTSVKFSENIKNIGSYAFIWNNFTKIDLSILININYIDKTAFCANNNELTRDNFIGIKEFTYDYFNFNCNL